MPLGGREPLDGLEPSLQRNGQYSLRLTLRSPIVIHLSSEGGRRTTIFVLRCLRATIVSTWLYLFASLGPAAYPYFGKTLSWSFARLVDLPVAVVGMLLPYDARPVNICFNETEPNGLANHRWPSTWQHLRVSIPVLVAVQWAGARLLTLLRRRLARLRRPAASL